MNSFDAKPAYAKLIIAILFLSSMLLSACQKEKPPIKIGFTFNQSKMTTLSSGVRNGVYLAVETINERGGISGRKIELIVKDDCLDAQTAIEVDKELIESDVAAIIGHIHSPMSLAAVPVVNQAKMVLLSPITATGKLSGLDDYFFRIIPPSLGPTIRLAKYAYNQGIRKIAVVYDAGNKEYAQVKYLEFKKVFESLGGTVSPPLKLNAGNVLLSNLAQKITQDGPCAYFIIANPQDGALVVQHIRKLDRKRPILASGWIYDEAFIKNGGVAVEGVVFSHSFQHSSKSPKYLEFKENYLKRYRKLPWMWETYGYESVWILAQALSLNSDPKELKQTLLSGGPFHGLQGDIQFDEYGENQKKPFLFMVKKGEFVEIP